MMMGLPGFLGAMVFLFLEGSAIEYYLNRSKTYAHLTLLTWDGAFVLSLQNLNLHLWDVESKFEYFQRISKYLSLNLMEVICKYV